jgi:hypothetical protein
MALNNLRLNKYSALGTSRSTILFQRKSVESCFIVDAHQGNKSGELLLLTCSTAGRGYVLLYVYLLGGNESCTIEIKTCALC